MTIHMKTVIAALGLAIALPAASPLHAQTPAQAPAAPVAPSSFANAPLTRVGVVVRDVKKSAQVYKDIFQLEAAPAVTDVTIELPKGRAKVKRAVVALPNITIEVDQPDGNSAAQEYLKKFGQGIYRLGFSTPDAIAPKVAGLEANGGKLLAGSKTGKLAWVDMRGTLGTVIEIQQEALNTAKPPAGPQIVDGKAILGKTTMSHLGFAAANSDQLSQSFADAFGMKATTIREFKPVDIPPNYKADPNATLRLGTFSTGGPGIEMIQSLGETNWTDFVSKHGNQSMPQHLAFPVGDRLKQTVELFQAKGAQWTNGKVGGSYEYLDFTETLGIIFEINGKWVD